MALWLPASSLWNSMTVGLASASFCQIANADLKAFTASAGLPVSLSRMTEAVLAFGQVALEPGDRRMGVSQLLLDRQRRLVEPSTPRLACRVCATARGRYCCGCRQIVSGMS